MKIKIREKGGVHMTLYFPTAAVIALLGSRVTMGLSGRWLMGKKRGTEEADCLPGQETGVCTGQPDRRSLRAAQRKLKRCLSQYRGFTLVETETSDGDYVKILL